MTTVSLGKIAFKWRSTYNSGTTYMKQDVVSYLGSTFVCILDSTVGVTPTNASANWNIFAQGTTGVSSSSGQILYNNGSGLVALPAGLAGQVLTVGSGGLPVWATPQVRSSTKVLKLPENASGTQPNSYRMMGVIMTDGSIRAWGQQSYYKLGDGTTFSRSYPTRTAFPAGFVGASKLYYWHDMQAACIDSSGQLWLWGNNDYGSCGNGNLLVTRVPFNASADSLNSIFGKTVTQVALSCGVQNALSTVVLCSDGTVHACGYNAYGQLGNGSTTNASRFAQLPVLANITQIASGRENLTSYYAITSAGALYSWGYNGDGQLGDGGTTNATIATLRTGGSLSGKTITKVFGGPNYAMAIDSAGNLHAWGTNTTYGNLGNGTLSNQFTPVQSVTGGVADVYIGQYDYPITYIKKTDNSLWACGAGDYWANGVTPINTNTGTFTQILTGSINVTVAAVSGSNKFFLDGVQQATITLQEGSTYVFNQSAASNATHPIKFSITANGTHGGGVEYTTGVTSFGTPGSAGAYTQIVVAVGAPTLYYYCANHSLMGGTINTVLNPTASSFSGAITKAIHGGTGSHNFGAALMQNGSVRVWGYNGNGALGLGDVTVRTNAINSMLTGNRVVTDICAYGTSSEQGIVMLLDDGQLFAVGYGGGSQLPEDDSETSYTPMPVVF